MQTTSTQQYTVNSMKKLVDLNGDMINFITNFTAKSTNNEEFECLVVDQNTLDNDSELQYKKVPGIITGTVSSDKNIYQNYYLILRSKDPCNVDVTLETQHLDDIIIQNKEIQTILQPQPTHQELLITPQEPEKSLFMNWKTIIAVASICFVVYFVFIKNNTPTYTSSSHSFTKPSTVENIPTPIPSPISKPTPSPTPISIPNSTQQPVSAFAEKLKAFNL
jgi:hypothetical protein